VPLPFHVCPNVARRLWQVREKRCKSHTDLAHADGEVLRAPALLFDHGSAYGPRLGPLRRATTLMPIGDSGARRCGPPSRLRP